MAYRCRELELINANQYSYVFRQLNREMIRETEPLDEKFQTREPSILSGSIKLLLNHDVRSKSQIEEALALNVSDIESLCALPAGSLESRVVPFTPHMRST